ncbi:Piwi-domain-containing protein [Rhizophagus irregularis]|uniref:Piwi-domain-containing protein n=1 Tax=Rhizophagus irregularis TaxID=588596 RepID=A0A2I1FXU3_9GLOM|nr:Piwi-domain-containing protein [Rhizophagus irregularis]
MMINIDFHATAFYESSSLTRIVKKVLNKRTIEELRDISERDRLKIENFLKNLKIYATHALNRRFRISKVTNTSDSNTTTFDDNGNQTDVASCFQRKYNMQLQHPFLPCIVIREETYLPLEVCNVVEGQLFMRKLNERHGKYDCQPSQSRANKINQGDIENSLKQVWLKAGNNAKAQPQLILCILSNTGVSIYDAEIKRAGDTVIGVVTQCIQSRNMFAIKKQYCVNVCLKINAKLGGMNSFINPSQLLFVSESPTIILGASVIHPVPGDTSRPSIAAVTASIDAMASRYVASIRVQTCRQKTCERKPERILFYRNGVSEGQFLAMLEYEIKAIKVACKSLEVNYMTFVVAQKRHHTRFFPIDKKDGDRAGNCLPVSIVPSVYYARLVCRTRFHANARGTSSYATVKPELLRVMYFM